MLIGQSQSGKTHAGAEGCHVHLLCLCAHSSLVSEDGLHDEHIGEDDDSGWEEVVEDEDDNVVAPGLLLGKNYIIPTCENIYDIKSMLDIAAGKFRALGASELTLKS